MHAFNKQRIQSQMKALRGKFDAGCAKVFVATAVVVGPVGSAFAQSADGTYDPAPDVLKIAAAVVSAIAISAAFTAAYVGIKGSKLPRRGM